MLLAIDPSIQHLGWAILVSPDPNGYVASGTITISSRYNALPEEARIELMLQKLTQTLEPYKDKIKMIVIERPHQFGGFRSHAAYQGGGLPLLFLFVGALYYWAKQIQPTVRLIPVQQWKGQLPKTVTRERMEIYYQRKFQTFDESDAVGLAHWMIRRLQHGPDQTGVLHEKETGTDRSD